MLTTILFGLISGSSLVCGAIAGAFFHFTQRTIAAFMAFGSGVLICALTIGLMEEAFVHGGFDAAVGGFLIGGMTYIGGDYLIHLYGGRKHRRYQHSLAQDGANGLVIVLGAILDGIPESIAMGIALFSDPTVGIMMIVAIVISNFPEAITSVSGLKSEGFSRRFIIFLWAVVGGAVALTTVLSYLFLGGLDPNILGFLEALAAGAMLAMLSDSMIPEAYEQGGYAIGTLTVLGFLVTFVISRL